LNIPNGLHDHVTVVASEVMKKLRVYDLWICNWCYNQYVPLL